ncbi:MAG TPA: RluA family pseudouridine synthase [Candidatus Binatia bacterium]
MNETPFRFVVARGAERIDRLVATSTGSSRRTVREWLAAGCVRIDGRVAAAADRPPAGAQVTIDEVAQAAQPAGHLPAPRVLIESEDWTAIAKPAGLHCERGRSAGTVADFLESRYGDLRSVGERADEAGLVHRIDRDTSGVVVAARTAEVYRRLRAAFGEDRARKQYLALACGKLARPVTIDAPLARRATRMVVAGRHDEAIAASTRVVPLESGDGWCLVEASMRTGAMHQVRVHLAWRGLPLFGDTLYGGPELPGCRRQGQLLHAMRVEIEGELDVAAAAPDDFVHALAIVRGAAGRGAVTSSS